MKLININKNVVTISVNDIIVKQLTFPNEFKAIQYYIDITM